MSEGRGRGAGQQRVAGDFVFFLLLVLELVADYVVVFVAVERTGGRHWQCWTVSHQDWLL